MVTSSNWRNADIVVWQLFHRVQSTRKIVQRSVKLLHLVIHTSQVVEIPFSAIQKNNNNKNQMQLHYGGCNLFFRRLRLFGKSKHGAHHIQTIAVIRQRKMQMWTKTCQSNQTQKKKKKSSTKNFAPANAIAVWGEVEDSSKSEADC